MSMTEIVETIQALSPLTDNAAHVLVVDDEEAFLRLTSALLRRAGYECTCVLDGAAAKDRLRERNYDLLVADIHMPGNTELELIRELPQINEAIPVILVTGYPSVESAVQSVQLPVIAYLVKPFTNEEFISQVQVALERGRLHKAVSRMRRRLQDWRNDLDQLTTATAWPSPLSSSGTVKTIQLLTLRNVAGALGDLKMLPEALPHLSSPPLPEAAAQLSPREREILQSLLTQHRVALVARHLRISPYTVRNHLKSIFRKLGVHSQSELLDQLHQAAQTKKTP